MRAIGMILAGGSSNRMGELAKKRAVCAMPIAGLYRSIDFALSNMTNSHIQTVAVFTQYNAGSLNAHLSSSKWWDFGRKQGGLFIFTPTQSSDANRWYRGTADAIGQNLDFLRARHEPYVIITSGDCVYKMDYTKLLDYHIRKNADITVAVKDLPATMNAERYGTVRLDGEDRVIEFAEKPVVARSNTVSTGVYVLRRRALIELIEKAEIEERYDFVRDILVRYCDTKKIYGYKFPEYWSNIASIEDYYRTNMDFLRPEIRNYFFREFPSIMTRVSDLPPAKYNLPVPMKNSLVASGTIINGEVENSVIFKESYIGNRCVIRNSIIMNDVYIGDDTRIENCIVESHSTIAPGQVYEGTPEDIRVVVEKNERFIL